MQKRINHRIIQVLITGIFLLSLTACQKNRGTLLFYANGEDFVANGFVSRDGWQISFDNVLVNLGSITAYNPRKPELTAELPGTYFVNLKDSPVVRFAERDNLKKGNYQSLKFSLSPMDSPEYKGFTIVMEGNAVKETQNIRFLIKLDEELTFDGKEGYVGDSIKGLLKDESADVEITFHFDHIFGDFEADPDNHVNTGSPGFDFFLPFARSGRLSVEQQQLKDLENYNLLTGALESLGHLGEGHCEVIR